VREAPLVVLLDANALWSAPVRDTLLLSAEHDLFRPAWTLRILHEMAESLKAKRPDLNPARIDRTVDRLLEHFPEALVANYEDLVPRMRNHEGDRHVLAAAVRIRASVVVTWNIQHFPSGVCDALGITVQTPDGFLTRLWLTNTAEVLIVLREQAGHLTNPPRTVTDVLTTLERSIPHFVSVVRESGLIRP
jgi:hypothetical protein